VIAAKDRLVVYLQLDPSTVDLKKDFSRDVTNIGHWATGRLQLYISDRTAFELAKPLINRAYQEN